MSAVSVPDVSSRSRASTHCSIDTPHMTSRSEGKLAAAGTRTNRRALPSPGPPTTTDRKSTRLNSSHVSISYAVFCLKKKKTNLRYCLLIKCKSMSSTSNLLYTYFIYFNIIYYVIVKNYPSSLHKIKETNTQCQTTSN